jgi:two-component system response regulator (stage 0 sporulation protein F)
MKHRSILIVDDDEGMRALLAEVFRQAGYTVALATDGQEALDSVEQAEPNVILSDFNMPVMDGRELVRALKNRHIATPFIMMTASPEIAMIQEEMASAVCLRKPFEIAHLLSVVNRVA